ncbi:MAG: strawberry notch family protein [Bacteroidales bacterium]|jgi:hypothetical protein
MNIEEKIQQIVDNFKDIHKYITFEKGTGSIYYDILSELSEKEFKELQKAALKENIVIIHDKKQKQFRVTNNNLGYIINSNRIQRMIDEELSGPYYPGSEACQILDTIVPDSMDYETHIAVRKIKHIVGGSLYEYVKKKLNYNDFELCKSLSAEQIDAVALAIYNIEFKKQGMIIGDQTGIGKGRVAAAMIRYGRLQGHQPIFISEKPNLFSDIYRDLSAIGSAELVPFIVNAKDNKTDVKDENGNVVYQSLPPAEQMTILQNKKVPGNYDYILGTYSQFNSLERNVKPDFLLEVSQGNILIMDEAHNASGASNTGEFLQQVISGTKGVVFLSATFAKRPDNMPIYAMKTAMADCNMTKEDLVEAIKNGGVALQEVLSAQLVSEGQMIRRERSFDGVEVNYITLDDKEQEHKAISDNITEILRDIIEFQENGITPVVDELDKIAAAEGKEMEVRKGTNKAGVDNTPYFSKVFNVINQMLFSVKAESVADRAIQRLHEGKKPVIAFSSTMGAFLETMENESGMPLSNGDVINADFKTVLTRGLDSVMKYTEKDINGNPVYKKFEISQLSKEAQQEYYRIIEKINNVSTGITISPIDIIIQKIQDAGFMVAEVTGRKLEVQFKSHKEKGLNDVITDRVYKTGDVYYENGLLDGSKRKITIIGDADSDYIRAFSETEKTELRIDREQLNEFYIRHSEKSVEPISINEEKGIEILTHDKINSSTMGVVLARKRLNTTDAFRQFNNNEIDCLLINQSGSTGVSAHAIITDRVPASEVKQRVMLILQAELNINTEVQKRGRINRTGQIYKPIYDYVCSAIPAEKRLMMMLQKKLKSLDANTTSNQKQSSKLLQTDDFLNKYGDKIVTEYLFENKELNIKIGDPLDFEGDNKDGRTIPEDAAHKVSGRVAVLSTNEQAEFYKEILDRYNDYVEYLKQVDEYDLEVEILNLDAETIEENTVISGKGGGSSFGNDSMLEKCEVNILKKPFTKTELENIIRESLQGKQASEIQKESREKLKIFTENKINEEVEDANKHYDELISKITEEKGYKKIPPEDSSRRNQYVKDRENELNTARTSKIVEIKKELTNKFEYIDGMFEFFYVGRCVDFPKDRFDEGTVKVPAVFLGFIIDDKRSNPFAPSAIKARFAISDSQKYVALALSGEQGNKVQAVIGASYSIYDEDKYIKEWETLIKSSSKSRGYRYILTGNLLQAASKYKGKLISYTTKDGSTQKGILMPENWNAEQSKNGPQFVYVPIIKALKYIKSLTEGKSVVTPNNAIISRTYSGYRFSVPKSKVYKPIYEDKDIRDLLENKRDGFEMISGNMVGKLEVKGIEKLVKILQDKYNFSLSISQSLFETLVESEEIEKETKSKKDNLTEIAEKDLQKDKEVFEKRIGQKAIPQETQQSSTKANALKLKLKLQKIKLELLEI